MRKLIVSLGASGLAIIAAASFAGRAFAFPYWSWCAVPVWIYYGHFLAGITFNGLDRAAKPKPQDPNKPAQLAYSCDFPAVSGDFLGQRIRRLCVPLMPPNWQFWLAFAVMALAVAALVIMLVIDSARVGIFGP